MSPNEVPLELAQNLVKALVHQINSIVLRQHGPVLALLDCGKVHLPRVIVFPDCGARVIKVLRTSTTSIDHGKDWGAHCQAAQRFVRHLRANLVLRLSRSDDSVLRVILVAQDGKVAASHNTVVLTDEPVTPEPEASMTSLFVNDPPEISPRAKLVLSHLSLVCLVLVGLNLAQCLKDRSYGTITVTLPAPAPIKPEPERTQIIEPSVTVDVVPLVAVAVTPAPVQSPSISCRERITAVAKKRDVDDAIIFAESCLQSYPNDKQVLRYLTRAHFQRGTASIEANRKMRHLTKARIYADRLKAMAPEDPWTIEALDILAHATGAS